MKASLVLPFMVAAAAALDLTVTTSRGRITGHKAPQAENVYEFLGVPFAKPPVGELRFAPPAKLGPASSSAAFVADKFTGGKPVDYPEHTPQFQKIINAFSNTLGNPVGEDCLYLNVWSKKTGKKNKPVVVFFYGGRWSIGGANTPFYTGKYLADAEDVVVVTVNFRLNIFGYPGAPGESQNLGMQDQRLAVEWIQSNIGAFNGDSSKITIFGQSSGGLAVDFWAYAYKKDPIVAGVIALSGNAYSFPLNTLELAAQNWYNVSEQLGCGAQGDTMKCMRQANWDDIRAAAAKVPPPPGTSQARSQPPFQATIDEKLVFSDYYERAQAGNLAKIPYMLGNNQNEAGYYKVPAYGQGKILNQSVWDDFNLECFTCATALEAAQRVASGVPTWRYVHHGDWDNTRLYPTSGAYHGVDLHMIFGASADVSGLPEVPAQTKAKGNIQKAYAAFAADPVHGLTKKAGWPAYDPKKNTLIELSLNNNPKPVYSKASKDDVGDYVGTDAGVGDNVEDNVGNAINRWGVVPPVSLARISVVFEGRWLAAATMTINYGQGTPERPSKGYVLFITATVMVIVSGSFVMARMGQRYKSQLFGWDDYTIAFSLFCSIILTVTINIAVLNGYGMHVKALSHEELTTALGWFYGSQIIYKVLLGATKSSLLLFYMRIFVGKRFQMMCWACMAVVIAWSVGSTFATIFQCIPVAAFWDKSIKDPKCTDTDAFWVAYAVINIITDFIILLLPIWEIRKLQLPLAQKISLMGIFALGGFVCATSIIRTNAVAASVANKKDSTWTFIPRSTWTLVEANVGIICACLPMMRGLLATCMPCLERRKSTNERPSRYTYPLDSGSHTWVRSDGVVMSSARGAGTKKQVNDSEEEIFAMEGRPRFAKQDGIVKQTDVRMEVDERGQQR
ncbi:hypothetical protein O988_01662 [Pseudogymnoascus sp. VKM F-3808]|nr:hypothetical protein O988_01662 [Pseudogymnoascus sp. VKM F-3808]